MALSEDAYVCNLSESALQVAKEELKEDPQERLGHVETLRTWITQQAHFTAPTDTVTLLKFLRTAKFSQLRARQVLENNIRMKAQFPEWLNDIDMAAPGIQRVLDSSYIVVLPKHLPNGRRLILSDAGAMKLDGSVTKDDIIRTLFGMACYYTMEEHDMVNGFEFFQDMTHFSMKTLTFWGMDTTKKVMKIWQGNIPGRFKAFHYFNPGPLFESFMGMTLPFLSKKIQERIQVHGKNMEEVYKRIPREYFPADYLPDEYSGPSQGWIKDIVDKMRADLVSPRIRDRILYETSSRWKYDKSQKPHDVPAESFRKLNVD